MGAQKGVLVCPKGISEAAKRRAEGLQIALYSPFDTDVHKWQIKATIPALCDFRSVCMSFSISHCAPVPFSFCSYIFYSDLSVKDKSGRSLGSCLKKQEKVE